MRVFLGGLFTFVIKCTQLNTTHSNVCLQNPEVEINAFLFGLINHRNHSFFADHPPPQRAYTGLDVNWTWLRNGLIQAISQFCLRDTKWLNLFKDFHHLDNFGNDESYLFFRGLWCVLQEKSIRLQNAFASFSICMICIV